MSDKNPLHGKQFSNIGIDRSFIQQNATKHNDQVNEFYHGGQRNESHGPADSTPKTEEVQKEGPINMEEPSTKEQENHGDTMSINIEQLKQELATMMDKKVHDLAVKMQEYANQTDKRIEALEAKLVQAAMQQSAAPQAPPAQQTLQTPQQSAPVQEQQEQTAPPQEKKAQFQPGDVEITKMFNFSNNPSGKIRR